MPGAQREGSYERGGDEGLNEDFSGGGSMEVTSKGTGVELVRGNFVIISKQPQGPSLVPFLGGLSRVWLCHRTEWDSLSD